METTTTSSSSDPFESISNFFDSGAWDVTVVLLQVFAVGLWLALVYWTFQDARRRIHAPGLIALCVAMSLLIPYLGSIIYLVVRPPEYLDEARERELELLALEQRLGELGDEEGKEIVGKLLAREGLTAGSDSGAVQRALRQVGVALQDDVKDLDTRLTELEFRLRLSDRAPGGAEGHRAERRRREPSSNDDPIGNGAGDTGRRTSTRRTRHDQDAYD